MREKIITKHKLKDFFINNISFIIPTILLFISIIIFVIDICFNPFSIMRTFQLIGAVLLLYIYPLAGLIFKKYLSVILQIIVSLHVIASMRLGSFFGFYGLISSFDLIVHGFFGVEMIFITYLIIIKSDTKMNFAVFFIFSLLISMGCGAFWEIIEYICDLITGGDCMHVYDVIEGVSPVADTIEDLIITFIGSILSLIAIFIDKLLGYKFMRYVYIDFKKDSINEYIDYVEVFGKPISITNKES